MRTEENILHETTVAMAVGKYIEANGLKYIPGLQNMGQEEMEHILRIGTSIMLNHWDLAIYPPGSFVKAIVEGDLDGAFARADHINTKAIRLYVMMKHNLSYPF